MQPVLKNKLQEVEQVLKSHHVQRAYVFGSVVTDHFHPDSDVDFLVTFKEIPLAQYVTNYWSLEDELEKLLERKVDIVVEKSLTNPYFIKVLNQTKTPIYE